MIGTYSTHVYCNPLSTSAHPSGRAGGFLSARKQPSHVFDRNRKLRPTQNGALAVSDPLNFPVKAQSELAITMYLEAGQTTNDITSHPGSRATTWFSFGNHVGAENLTDPSTQNVAHW